MVKIRLKRVGAKNKPIYRIVAADSRAPRDGAFIELVGHYNPLANPETFDVDREKALKWLNCGAKPTGTVARLLVKSGISEAAKFIPVRKSESTETQSTTKTKSATKETS
jgi:small subunit ribosomal protein S16